MAANRLIKAFQDNGTGGFQECETEVFETSEKNAVQTINKQVASLVTKTANFTFALTEAGAYIRSTGASNITATVPASVTTDFPAGTIITVRQAGAGVVNISNTVGVTLNGYANTSGQNKSLQIIKVGNDTWDIVGGVV
jgi:hypothetical protein